MRNCLFKVLKLKNTAELGDNVVVQGGTFRNHSIVRALEKTLGLRAGFSDMPELMGAYGCALYAMGCNPKATETSTTLAGLVLQSGYSAKELTCPGCGNHCRVRQLTFPDGHSYYTANNCEKVFYNRTEKAPVRGVNMFEERYRLLFRRESPAQDNGEKRLRIGIPRGLGMYEDYPFWHTLLTSCGIEPVLSDQSSEKLYDKGIRYTMSDNICFPAKLIHGHIINLAEKHVDRILYPTLSTDARMTPRPATATTAP